MHICWCMVVSSSYVASVSSSSQARRSWSHTRSAIVNAIACKKKRRWLKSKLVMWKSIMFWNWPWKNLLSLTEWWFALLSSPHSTIFGWNKARNVKKLSIKVSLKYKCVFSHLHKCLNSNHMLHLQVFIHYYKMWVQFVSPCSLDQWIHYFFIGPYSLQIVNSLQI